MSEIANKIKSLKTITPNRDWVKSNRDFLLSEIKSRRVESEADLHSTFSFQQLFSFFAPQQAMRLAFRTASIVAIVAMVIVTSGVTVTASQKSIPGDKLYIVKRMGEQAQLAMTLGETAKTKLHIDMAGKRLDEVKAISQGLTPAKDKAQKISMVMQDFKTEMETVKSGLDNLNKDKNNQEAVDVAQTVGSRAQEFEKQLEEVKINSNLTQDKEAALALNSVVNAALDSMADTGNKATEVLDKAKELAGATQVLPIIDGVATSDKIVSATGDANLAGEGCKASVDVQAPVEKEIQNENPADDINIKVQLKNEGIPDVNKVFPAGRN